MNTKDFLSAAVALVVEHAKRCEPDETKRSKITNDVADILWVSDAENENTALILLRCYGYEVAYLVTYVAADDKVMIIYYTINEMIEIEDFNSEC